MTIDEKELSIIREKIVSDIMSPVPDANGVVKILASNEIDDFKAKNKFAVIDFYATWCPPCKIMDPITKNLAEVYKGKLAFAKINTDQEREAAMKYQIRYVPTFYLFKDGEIVTQFSGARKKKDFIELIKKQFKIE
ncbi:MAG: thioredoxin [Candidatus Heimdallarchaeota archaeon]